MNKRLLTIPRLLVLILLASFTAVAQQVGTPPKIKGATREADLVELIKLDNTVKLDIRYARKDNFVGKQVYPEARAFLQRDAAEGVLRVHRRLKEQGLGIVIFDGYRPWSITKLFWEVTPEDKRKFVANPATGSRHNRGCAVDLSMYDLKTGELVPMPSDYDEFTERASPNYKGGTPAQRKNRDLLRRLMEAEGFTVNDNEWWHFDYKDWKEYQIYDIAFSEIKDLSKIEGLRIRRLEFNGNASTSDQTLRRAIVPLAEGATFTSADFNKSRENLDNLNLFEKVSDQNISWRQVNEATREIDLIFHLTEKRKNKR